MKVGFLGLGNMGRGMATSLLAAGHSLTVYNRTPEKARRLEELGAQLASTPHDAALDAEVVLSMVGDDNASRDVWISTEGALQGLPKEAMVIECSTLSHEWVDELSRTVQASGHAYLDAPVTGLPDAAAAGALTLFLGGDTATIVKAEPVLSVISERQIHFGDIGAGTAYKLIVNLMGSIQILAAAEGLVVAEKAGLDPRTVADALSTGGAASPTVARVANQMVEGTFDRDVVFSTLWRLKDTLYGTEFARKMGLNSALASSTLDSFQQVADAGYSQSSESKVIDLVRKS